MGEHSWYPGAERVPTHRQNPMANNNNTRKATFHRQEGSGWSAVQLSKYVIGKGVEYSIIVDAQGRVAQIYPFETGARSLLNGGIAGGIGCNRSGTRNVQLCATGYTAKGWESDKQRDKCAEIAAWLEKYHNIPAVHAGDGSRSATRFVNKSGWYSHAEAPGNSHTDRPPEWGWLGTGEAADKPVKKPAKLKVTSRTLRKGNTGVTVRRLQSMLGISVDGKFGPKTDAAVRKVQKDNGIKADGVVGPETWGALGVKYYKPITVSKVLQPGDKGNLVKTLQTRLGVKATGVYDAVTVQRVKAFQKARGLDADGIVGKKTWSKVVGVTWGTNGELVLPPGVKLPTDKVLVAKLRKLSRMLGKPITIVSGHRTYAEQRRLWDLYQAGRGNLAAYPNANAPHIRGIAADCNIGGVSIGNIPGARAAMRKLGLCLPAPGEAWHVQRGNTWRA